MITLLTITILFNFINSLCDILTSVYLNVLIVICANILQNSNFANCQKLHWLCKNVAIGAFCV